MHTTADFERDSVWRLIAKNGVPAMLTMVVVIVYNLADTFFVGQTHNDLMVAAVSVAAPVFTLLITVGTLIGSGGCSIVSRALGSRREDQARQTSSFCFYASLLTGALLGAALYLFCRPILGVIGATDQTMELAETYLKIIAVGAPFIVFSNTMANLIRADGAAGESMKGNMMGTVLNIILDPVMILWFRWGIAGAAIATVLGNVCACVYYGALVKRRGGGTLSCSLGDLAFSGKVAGPSASCWAAP